MNLTATSGDARVNLSWDAAANASSYSVYRSTSTGSVASGSAIATGLQGTSYADLDAENGITYYYQVTGVADQEGDPSNEVAATPFPEPPPRPQSLEKSPPDEQHWMSAEQERISVLNASRHLFNWIPRFCCYVRLAPLRPKNRP